MTRTPPLRVLFIAHNHPRFHPGGAEIYAFELYQAFRESGRALPTLVTKTPWGLENVDPARPFTRFEHDREQMAWTPPRYDDFEHRSLDGRFLARQVRDLLDATRPDVVHLQHFSGIGLDLVPLVRRLLPRTPILLTLHEFLPICNARGLMMRPDDGQLCRRPSAVDCHRCFPQVGTLEFHLRKRRILAHLEGVDVFLAPSQHLRRTYIDWGLPEEKVVFHDYGRLRPPRIVGGDPPVDRFGFFGQTMRHKGILLLLEAMEILQNRGFEGAEVVIHGANARFDGPEFLAELDERLARTRGLVSHHGAYRVDDLPGLLHRCAWVVVPSLWWENSPLVVQEAFQQKRPVICGREGGSGEKVVDEVSGLHFQNGNAGDLARVLERASGDAALWSRLRAGIPEIRSLDEETVTLSALYESLIARRRVSGSR